MRHKRSKKILNMKPSHREAVITNLVISMLKCGKLKTTLAKAKYFAPCMEKLITRAKVKPLAENMRFFKKLRLDENSIKSIHEVAKKFSDRKGGYTRIIKSWKRYGDAADVAVVEFVS